MIDIRHLRKEYDDTVALDNLTLEIPRGEVFGLIGPNGAGKTTLIRILATLLEPTFGSVRVDGIDILAEPLRVHPLIGYMSDYFALYENMLVWEYLDHFARCYKIPLERRDKLVGEVLQLVSLEVRRDAEVKSLSRGMKQRLCFAKTLLHEPKVLLLDEPASGLDPAGRLEFRELIKQLYAMGRTVLISSHILTDMSEFCTSVAIMEEGRVLASGRVDDIIQRLQPALRLEVECVGPAERLAQFLQAQPEAAQVKVVERLVHCQWNGARESLPFLHRRIVQEEIDLIAFAVKTDNLEDIYMRISSHRTS
jgi:ABC-2 type transport system ATP-binding protein